MHSPNQPAQQRRGQTAQTHSISYLLTLLPIEPTCRGLRYLRLRPPYWRKSGHLLGRLSAMGISGPRSQHQKKWLASPHTSEKNPDTSKLKLPQSITDISPSCFRRKVGGVEGKTAYAKDPVCKTSPKLSFDRGSQSAPRKVHCVKFVAGAE